MFVSAVINGQIHNKAEIIIAKGKYEAGRVTRSSKGAASANKASKGLSLGQKAALICAALIVVAAVAVFAVNKLIPGFSLKPGKTDSDSGSSAEVQEAVIADGVTVENIDVGGMTQNQAAAEVTEWLESRTGADFEVAILDDTVKLTGEDFLVSADVDTACLKAAEAEAGERIPLPLYEDSKVLTLLTDSAKNLNVEKIDYSYEIQEDQLGITVGSGGKCVDVSSAAAGAVSAFFAGKSGFVAEETVYEAEPIDIDKLYAEINVPAQDAYYDEKLHQIVDGVPGYAFDAEEVKKTLVGGEAGQTYWFPLEVTKPAVSYEDVSDSLFKDVLYTYTSNLTNIPNRTNNVKLAAAEVNGTVLYPGDEFNFDEIVGERTEERGYKAADVYVGGDTVPQLGGGICQVASTIYVCTLYCDLKVTERTEHMYFCTYVPAGLDATIYWGNCNYRFVNDKNYPILIETKQEGLTLTVTFKGTKENDNYVEMVSQTIGTNPFEVVEEVDETKPVGYSKVKTTGYTGYKVKVTRNVYAGDGTLISSTQESISNYKRRDKIIIVGPSEKTEEPVTDPTPTEPIEDPAPVTPEEPDDPDTPVMPVTPPEPEDPLDNPFGDPTAGE